MKDRVTLLLESRQPIVIASRNVTRLASRYANQWHVIDSEISSKRAQVELQRGLSHDNVLQLLGHHVIDTSRHALVFELCHNGTVRHLLTRTPGGLFTEPVARRYFRQMHAAVAYLHGQSVVHRDIRAENFMLDACDRVKLIDFSAACRYFTNGLLFIDKQVIAGRGDHPLPLDSCYRLTNPLLVLCKIISDSNKVQLETLLGVHKR